MKCMLSRRQAIKWKKRRRKFLKGIEWCVPSKQRDGVIQWTDEYLSGL